MDRRPYPMERDGQPWLNQWLDRLADPHRDFFGVPAPAYLVFGACGVAAGFAIAAVLAIRMAFPVIALAALSVAALATFVSAGLIRKAILHRDCHVLLEDVLTVLAVTWLSAHAAHLPVLSAVDLVSVGIAVFLIWGRLGCLAGGCCHGRPSALGVRYPAGSVNSLLAGIRLFPIQLVETFWLAIIAVPPVAVLWMGAPPGRATWTWLLSYSPARFMLEFARGDVRPQWGPLSEPQWLCLAIVGARAAVESGPTWLDASIAVAIAGAGWLTHRWWLAVPGPDIPLRTVHSWLTALTNLENEACAFPGREVASPAPCGCRRIRLLADPAGDDRQVHSYALDECDASPYAIGGMIEQRLPPHQVLRASFCESGVFHLWFLLDPSASRGSAVEDPPLLVLQRAEAFGRMLREMSSTIPRWGGHSAWPGAGEPPAPPQAPADQAAQAWYFRSAAPGLRREEF